LPKKIALVANSTWNIFNFRQNIIKKLVDQGHDVLVIAPIDEYITYREHYKNLKHISLRSLDRDGTNPIKDFLLILELYRKYKREKPDLIIHYTHKPNIFGSLAARMCNIKSFAVVTGLGYAFIREGWLNYIMKSLYKYTAGQKEMIIFENIDDQELFKSLNIITSSNSENVNGCGVDIDHYFPVPKTETSPPFIFTFIGRLLKDKGIREFAHVAKELKSKYKEDIKFVVLGDFDLENPSTIDRENLLLWIQNGYIEYKGFVKDVRPFIAESDCIVLPSYREGLPRIVIEGMSMEKPVITSNTAGCRQTVVNCENGFLVNVEDTVSLENAIEKFITLDFEHRKQLGKKGREIVISKFDSNKIADKIYDLIQAYL
jgi:glycosyltransferase involved in cell wall biosynthesis